MQDWETDWSRDVLERIVALLFALAGLAELAADAPFHRRRNVLAVLSHGEAEARAFVIGVTTGAPVPENAPGSIGDATRLAASFRALALVLCVLLARRFALPGTDHPHAGWLAAVRPAGRQPPTPDTS